MGVWCVGVWVGWLGVWVGCEGWVWVDVGWVVWCVGVRGGWLGWVCSLVVCVGCGLVGGWVGVWLGVGGG